MQSASKKVVPRSTLSELVRQHFGTRPTLKASEELKEGYFNTAYLLQLSDGRKCVLKIAPPDEVRTLTYEKNIMKTEVEVINLARTQTEMPVPEIYCYDSTRRHIGSDYYMMEYFAGTPLHKLRSALSTGEQVAIDREIGRLLHQLNAIHGTWFGYPGQAQLQGANWPDVFGTLLQTVLTDGKSIGAVLPRPYDSLYEEASQRFTMLTEVTVPRLTHWDLWDGNIFVDPHTKRITGIIDFERALWADPLMEANFGVLKGDGPFMEGYGEPMFDTETKVQRRHLYDLYLFLIMVIEAYYRDYVEADITRWARGRLDETLKALQIP